MTGPDDPISGEVGASEDLRRADAIATALSRGLVVDPIGWGELLAIAQREVARYQQRQTLEQAVSLYSEDYATPIIAAARIILSVAERPHLTQASEAELVVVNDDESQAGMPYRERTLLLILASAVFSMYGNFPSAVAVQRHLSDQDIRSESQWLTLAVSNPRQIPAALRAEAVGQNAKEFLERLNHFLVSGDVEYGLNLMPEFETLMVGRVDPSDVVFLRCARLGLKHLSVLATAKLKNEPFEGLFRDYVARVVDEGRVSLLPPQHHLIHSDGFLSKPFNSIVTIPTSTGKTLLGELAIAASLQRPQDIAIYVTPYVALGRQVHDCIRSHAPSYVNVCGYFGNFNTADGLWPDTPTVIVATPERLDGLLRSQNLYGRLKTIVFDEAHTIESGMRGARIESLITRVRLQQEYHAKIRIILLSAVLTDVERVRNWLGPQAVHYHDSWRPTARRIAFWSNNGALSWLYGNDPLRPASRSAGESYGSKNLPWPVHMSPTEHFGGITQQKPAAFKNVAYLGRYLQSSIGGPVLIACASKAATRGVAAAVAESVGEVEPTRAIDSAIGFIRLKYPHLRSLAAMLEKRVAYHNASLPVPVRVKIEDAIKSKEIHFVAATTTLAEGVDLPFRSTIIFDWLMGYGDDQAPMSPLLFRNIAGRCGRAGEFVEGDTVIFDNMLGSLSFTDHHRRRAAQQGLFSDPPPLKSAIANDNQPSDVVEAVQAVVASQLLASIPENPTIDDLEVQWAAKSYAAYSTDIPKELLRGVRQQLLSREEGEPFAIAASPMKLTPLGIAANRSGFGPGSCRKILSALPELPLNDPVPNLVAKLLLSFGGCAEQTNYLLRDIARRKRTQFYVKADDLAALAAGWLAGTPLIEMFGALPKAVSSKAAVTPARWIDGEAEYEPIAAQYDKFVDVVEYSFGSFSPWLLRAIGALSDFGPEETRSVDWAAMAKLFEDSRLVDAEAIDEQTAGLSHI